MPRPIPPPLGLALTFLRSSRGWTQKELARAAGIAPNVLSDYESGRRLLKVERFDRLIALLGLDARSADAALLGVELLGCGGAAAPARSSPGDPTMEERERIRLVAAGIARDAVAATVSSLRSFVREARERAASAAREEAATLWPGLVDLSARDRQFLLARAAEYRSWAMVERLCDESVKAAPADIKRAERLAALGLEVAGTLPGESASGLCLGFRGQRLAGQG
ncbi:MAG TPA: helix-turn-helix transcriptional regulator [Thermoanaerobaculia bacterium]|nr:helix-turn-helix transcriptional regulator [Thermoanaerobaculia bacterium]